MTAPQGLVEAAMDVLRSTLPGRAPLAASALSAVIASEWARVDLLPTPTRRLVGAASLRARVYTANTDEIGDSAEFEAEALRREPIAGLDAESRSLCHSAIAEAYLVSGRDRTAHAQARLALAYADEAADDACRFRASALKACALALNGEYHRASRASRRCRKLQRANGWEHNTSELPRILADLLVAHAHADKAVFSSTSEALSDSAHVGPIWLAYRRLAEGWLHLLSGENDQALAAAIQLTGGSDLEIIPSLVTGFAFSLQSLALSQRREPQRALSMLEGLVSPGDHALCLGVPRATAHLQLGEYRDALIATDGCARAGTRHNLRTTPAVLVRRAIASFHLGHLDAGDRMFAEAFHLMSPSRVVGPLIGLGRGDLSVMYERLVEKRPDLERAVTAFRRRAEVCPPSPPPLLVPLLTPRETVVAVWIRTQLSLGAIAAELFVSRNTLKTQLRSLYAKLGVSSRADAVALLERTGFYERRGPLDEAGELSGYR